MATPSLAMIPSAYADSKVYSVLPNNGDGDFTFNRDSSATRIGQNGLIQTVGFFGNELILSTMINTSYNTFNEASSSGFHAINTAGTTQRAGTVDEIIFVTGKIYTVNIDVSVVSGIAPFFRARQSIATSPTLFSGQLTDGNNVITFTSTDTLTGVLEFSNSAAAEYRVSNVSIKEIQGDQPRLNYDISNGVVQSCPSLLLEGASTNLITYSSDFSQSAWTKDNLTITSNSVISPDGSLNATKIIATTANGIHKLRQNLSTVTGTYTQSIFAKKGEYKNILVWDDTTSGGIGVNLDNLSIFRNQNNLGHKIENYGNEWVRISVTRSFSSQQMLPAIYMYDNSATPQISFAGNGVDGFYIFGAQVEEQSYATSLIPTNGASQTRAAETCFGAGTASTFNSTEGVLYAEIAAISNSTSTAVFSISDGTSSNALYVGFPTSSNVIQAQLLVGTAQTNMNHTVSDRTSFNKVAVLYQNNNHKMFINGVEVETDTSGSVPSANTFDRVNFNFGQGSFPFQGKCKDIRVYNEALTDAQLQTLTTL